jgi:hypothetical protein
MICKNDSYYRLKERHGYGLLRFLAFFLVTFTNATTAKKQDRWRGLSRRREFYNYYHTHFSNKTLCCQEQNQRRLDLEILHEELHFRGYI